MADMDMDVGPEFLSVLDLPAAQPNLAPVCCGSPYLPESALEAALPGQAQHPQLSARIQCWLYDLAGEGRESRGGSAPGVPGHLQGPVTAAEPCRQQLDAQWIWTMPSCPVPRLRDPLEQPLWVPSLPHWCKHMGWGGMAP